MPETDSICCSFIRGWRGHALMLKSTTSWKTTLPRYGHLVRGFGMWNEDRAHTEQFCVLHFSICNSCKWSCFYPFVSSYVSLCLLMLGLQVELDLKRLRDPLQLQLPLQQLTASKNWWEERLPLLLFQLQQPLFPPAVHLPTSPPLPLVLHSALFPPPHLRIPTLSWPWEFPPPPFFPVPPCFLLSRPKTLVRIVSKNASRGQEEWGEYQELENLRAETDDDNEEEHRRWWWHKLDFIDASSLQGTPEGANRNYHIYRHPKRGGGGGEKGDWCSL